MIEELIIADNDEEIIVQQQFLEQNLQQHQDFETTQTKNPEDSEPNVKKKKTC